MEHSFTNNIKMVLNKYFGENAEDIFEHSLLIKYINVKTKSANKGSKARSSFANLYAMYVIIEDYIANGFIKGNQYSKYEGAQFVNLFKRQRELPFGSKLQNHALNNRLNSEFQKFFPTSNITPILRDLETNRYWFNENLLLIRINKKLFNIAEVVIEIIDNYIAVKQESFDRFITDCTNLQTVNNEDKEKVKDFIIKLLAVNVDARLFEIVSYSILKNYYKNQHIIWGYDMEHLIEDTLSLYKTGRTNANDGGIDFVMRPLGRFFQVTETLDFKKYFLDIDKVEKYPITFVIKSEDTEESLLEKIEESALKTYVIEDIVDKYMKSIEELINITKLKEFFEKCCQKNMLNSILDEIVLQSKVEYNYED